VRTIDFGLVRNVDAHVAVGDFHGSDHRVVVFDCLWGRHRLRIGLWNVERDRDPGTVRAEVVDVLALHDLDALLLCEANDYLAELREIRGCELLAYTDEPGQAETAILIGEHVTSTSSWCPRLTRSGWITVRGGRTAPKYLPTVLLDGWLRVAVLHAPPSVRYRGGRGPAGPVRRVASMVGLMRRTRLFARRRPRARSVLIAGDWNATPDARGPYSPRWLARAGRLRIVAPKAGTHR
jgi:hypothetical protein